MQKLTDKKIEEIEKILENKRKRSNEHIKQLGGNSTNMEKFT